MLTRRQFLKLGAAAGAGFVIPQALMDKVYAFNLLGQALPLNPMLLPKYIDRLPIMPLINATAGGTFHIEAKPTQHLPSSQMATVVAPTNPTYSATDFWSYRALSPTTSAGGIGSTYLGPSFVIKRGVLIKIEWHNNLKDAGGNPIGHPLPVDPSLHWAAVPASDNMMAPPQGGFPANFSYTLQRVPISPHVHGGEQAPGSDGGPDTWFTPNAQDVGPAWQYAGDVQGGGATNQHNLYPYSNGQPTATIWYHDHALGITRLNVYMGLAGAYVVTDAAAEPTGLPKITDVDSSGNPSDIPLAIQDRMFDVNGQLYFPALGINPTVHPFWLPEFFGDTMLVNGVIWPYLDVDPKAYRFRLLNGSNARFYELSIRNLATGLAGPTMKQIATDGGYLYNPVTHGNTNNQLVIAPGERAEVIVDFSAFAGQTLTLKNSAKAPFPKGTPANPNTVGQIIQFRVKAGTGTVFAFPANPLNPSLATFANTGVPTLGTTPSPAGLVRILTLNEIMGPGGPLEVLLNLTKWMAPITEKPKKGSTEIWKIVNTTADTHPIHLHLTQFQLVNRQAFNASQYMKKFTAANGMMAIDGMMNIDPVTGLARVYQEVDPTPYLQGKPVLPDANERGWKDTVRMNPGEVTTIVVKFGPIDGSPDYPYDCTAEPGYVWHCHIIDHEDNEMMRPYKLVP